MKIYEVTNGWIGVSGVRCYVKANNEKEAIKKALCQYKKYAIEKNKPNTFYNQLKASVFLDENQEITEIRDE